MSDVNDYFNTSPISGQQLQGTGNPVVTQVVSQTTSSASPSTLSAASASTLQSVAQTAFDENILNSYQQVAYHIKFYAIGDGLNGGTGGTSTSTSSAPSGIIIAESGVTGYNIVDLQFDSFVGITNQTKNTIGQHYRMTITEPMGTSFLDALYMATSNVGVQDYTKCFYLLEISFKGYNEDGSQNTNICSNFPNGGKWIWQVQVADIEMHLDAAGGTYTFTGMIFHETALEKQWLRTQSPYMIVSQNVEEFFNNFSTALNNTIKTQYGTDLVTYQFDLQKTDNIDPKTFKFIQDETKDPYRMRAYSEQSKTKQSSNITKGSAITDIISDVFTSTIEGVNIIREYSGKKITDDGLGDGSYRAAGIFKAYPEVKIVGFDQNTNTYKKQITYHIRLYKSIASQLQATEVTDTSNSQKAISDIQSSNLLRKRYDYIHTGLNTEVLEYDIRFKFNWYAVLPKANGAYYYTEQYEPSAVYNQQQDQQLQNYTKNNTVSPALANALSISSTPVTGSNVISSLTANSTLNQLTSGVQKIVTTANSISGNVSALAGSIGSGSSSSSSQTVASGNSGMTYVEDIMSGANSKKNTIPLSIVQANDGPRHAAGTGFLGQWSRRKSIAGTILNQVEGPYGNEGLAITITIKGDPFWLGLSYDQMLSSMGNGSPSGTSQSSPVADFMAGDNCFALYFKYPYDTGETGNYTLRDNDVMNGIYFVKNISHSFSNGLFKQTLSGFRLKNVTSDDTNSLAASS